MERFQVGRSDTDRRSRLFEKAGGKLVDELSREIGRALGPGQVRFKVGEAAEMKAPGPRLAAAAMVEAASVIHERTRIHTLSAEGPRVHLWVLVGEVQDPGQPPSEARKVNSKAIRATLAFHRELSLAFPGYKTLVAYAPRPLKDQTPDGWKRGDPWPMFQGELASASEHAWGDGIDAGKAGEGGFDTGPSLKPLLQSITDYTRANRGRLGVVDHIFDGFRFHERDGFARKPYTGKDQHTTHTHTAFGEHDGDKPPWL